MNPVQEQYTGSAANLLTGLAMDEFYTRTDDTGVYTYLMDAQGSTIALTNAAAALQATYTYEAFGATTVAGATGNAYSYTGREDDGTGLKYYRARYYHPATHRFISQDPIRFRGGDFNLYAYVRNAPLQLEDPLGLSPGKIGENDTECALGSRKDCFSGPWGGDVPETDPSCEPPSGPSIMPIHSDIAPTGGKGKSDDPHGDHCQRVWDMLRQRCMRLKGKAKTLCLAAAFAEYVVCLADRDRRVQ